MQEKKLSPTKRVPMRQCVGCRTMKPKRDLVRVVRSPEAEVSLDFVGKKPGRGAYVCRDKACFARARKVRGFERALGHPIPGEVLDVLEAQVEQGEVDA